MKTGARMAGARFLCVIPLMKLLQHSYPYAKDDLPDWPCFWSGLV